MGLEQGLAQKGRNMQQITATGIYKTADCKDGQYKVVVSVSDNVEPELMKVLTSTITNSVGHIIKNYVNYENDVVCKEKPIPNYPQ